MFDFGKVKIDNYIVQINSKPNLLEVVDNLDTAKTILSYKGAMLKNHLVGGVRKGALRSEERRVGKECRSRWSPYH